MSNDPAYFRDQSARCRRLAKAVLDGESAARLTELAVFYEQRAAALSKSGGGEDLPARLAPSPAGEPFSA